MQDKYFNNFQTDVSEIVLPKKFTFPFSYEPHSLTKIAAKELQQLLSKKSLEKEISGKMYGVLVVKNKNNELGFLASFSGQDYEGEEPANFVPPIFNRLNKEGFFKKGEEELRQINSRIENIEKDTEFITLREKLKDLSKKADSEIKNRQLAKHKSKAKRKEQREEAMISLSPSAYDHLNEKLSKESRKEDFNYKKFTKDWKRKIATIQKELSVYESKIQKLKKDRKQKSILLQKKIFDQYQFLNIKTEKKGLETIFEPIGNPPSGAGDCALPKLLQYAFQNNYEPISMGEFWWGKAPKSELRKEGRFYPACSGKCKPILGHMLEGLNLEDDPLKQYTAKDKVIKTLYEDDFIAVIVKPAGLLSIPSKEIKDSVLLRMQKKYPKATGPLLAHRLDKMTSGIMLISKDLESHKYLQKQFMDKSISKRYYAILAGELKSNSGEVNLPLTVDEDNRPMQKVSFEDGRKAKTKWEVIDCKNDRTLVKFTPITGRTHQLRVHSAHPEGLNAPIVGDTLYGEKDERLMLHAQFIEFYHPKTEEKLSFEVDPDFTL
jgi:tRNA pseudouridine32 synthase/23S rRNA pseudouridine746 synthase